MTEAAVPCCDVHIAWLCEDTGPDAQGPCCPRCPSDPSAPATIVLTAQPAPAGDLSKRIEARVGLVYDRSCATNTAKAAMFEVSPVLQRLQTQLDHALAELSSLRDHRARWELEHERAERLAAELDEMEGVVTDLGVVRLQLQEERDTLRARLTGVAIHANRLKTRIAPGSSAWSVFEDLSAALGGGQ